MNAFSSRKYSIKLLKTTFCNLNSPLIWKMYEDLKTSIIEISINL